MSPKRRLRRYNRPPGVARISAARSFGLTFSIVGALAAWSFLAPSLVGGPVSLVIASGNSMHPTIVQGDLIALRRTTAPRIDDVVGYHSERTGRLVLHRIVGRDGDQFILQGDNNYWLDPDRPGESKIVGKHWVRIPGAGQALLRLQNPVAGGLLLAVITVSIALSSWPRQRYLQPRRRT